MEILLDGKKILNKELLFKSLKEQIKQDDFYGNNLDALWDVLSSNNDQTVITIRNVNELENNLGEYLGNLLNLFKELEDMNLVSKLNIE